MSLPVAVVTGASSGLGHGLALRLAEAGYGVGLLARRLDRLESLVGRIEQAGGRALAVRCDVSRPEDVRSALAACAATLGPVDLLVANAGVSGNTRITRPGLAEGVERVMAVNFLGAVYAVEAVLPSMLERDRGHIVAIGSLAGFRGLPLSAAYSASKAAMANFFESLRIDLHRTGVDVTLVRPGYVRTEMTDHNDHPMPFRLELDEGVDRVMRAIQVRRRSVAFPWPLARLAWISQIFPDAVYDWVASSVDRRKTD